MRQGKKLCLGLLFSIRLGGCMSVGLPVAVGAVAPTLVGDSNNDTVWVSFAVNDTLGNAANCDSAWVLLFYNGRVFDSVKAGAANRLRTGLYAVPRQASAGLDSVGAYWVQVRAYGVAGRTPHATYAYTVVHGGPVGELAMRGLVNDSNLAREATKTQYQSTTGPGPTPVRIFVRSAADSSSIENVHLTVKLAGDQTKKHEAMTGHDGWALMTLNLTAYDLYATANNYVFSTPALNLTVAGDSVRDTIWAEPFDPGAPAGPDLCRVYGWVYDLSGQPMANATVTARLTTAPVRYQDIVISPYERTTVSDSVGYWFLDVFPSEALTPNSAKYEFTVRYRDGAIARKKVAVPDSTAWLLVW